MTNYDVEGMDLFVKRVVNTPHITMKNIPHPNIKWKFSNGVEIKINFPCVSSADILKFFKNNRLRIYDNDSVKKFISKENDDLVLITTFGGVASTNIFGYRPPEEEILLRGIGYHMEEISIFLLSWKLFSTNEYAYDKFVEFFNLESMKFKFDKMEEYDSLGIDWNFVKGNVYPNLLNHQDLQYDVGEKSIMPTLSNEVPDICSIEMLEWENIGLESKEDLESFIENICFFISCEDEMITKRNESIKETIVSHFAFYSKSNFNYALYFQETFKEKAPKSARK